MTADETRAEELRIIEFIRSCGNKLPDDWQQWDQWATEQFKLVVEAAIAYTEREVVTLKTLSRHEQAVRRWYGKHGPLL